jgi:cold shock CspA family protein
VEIEFGHVQKYDTVRGFGFVSRTFRSANRLQGNNVWFHITKIKRDYPNLAKELDDGSFAKINFWYEIDNSDREKVSKIRLDPKDIPKQQRDSLVAYIEQLWCNPDNSLPEWLDSITIAVVGQVRKDELKQLYDDQIRKRNEVKEQKQIQIKSRLEQARLIKSRLEQARRSRNQTQSSKERVEINLDDAKNIQIPSARDRFRAERGVIEAIFSSDEMHGLPPELKKIVRPCPRHSRKNRLSYEPGGSDVVVAYSLGHAILYDWIKNVEWYIGSFERDDPGFHLHIQSIYGRFCEDKSERRIAVFCPIWDRDKDGAFKDAIKACLKRYQTQMDIGHQTLHEEAKKYWKSYGLSDQEVENLPTLYKQYMKEKGE